MNDDIVPQNDFSPVEVFDQGSKMGGYSFPFISTFKGWKVKTFKLEIGKDGLPMLEWLQIQEPTIRLIKDDGVMDIEIPVMKGEVIGMMSYEEWLVKTGIAVDKPTAARTHKRLSRLLRPSFWFRVYKEDEIVISEMDVDTDLYDGINFISKTFAKRHFGIDRIGQRFEITVMTDKGEAKGHAIIVEDWRLNGADIGIPKGSWKKEIHFTKGVFVDVRPFHGKNHLLADIQTVVNIYHETFTNAQLMGWLHDESIKFLEAMKNGEAEERMTYMVSNMTLEQAQAYPVFEFIASGGKLNWSGTMTKQFGKAWINRLTSWSGGKENSKGIRIPVGGGFRLYLCCASALGVTLNEGECYVDFKRASIAIADCDYIRVAGILGGGDQDDAINCIFDGVYVIMSRNPNGRGEFVRAKVNNPKELLDNDVHPVFLNWAKLSEIKRNTMTAEMHKYPSKECKTYEEYANVLMGMVQGRLGVLGTHVNVLTAWVLTKNDDHPNQPAALEQVIDACAKDLDIDLGEVQAWDRRVAKQLSKEPLCRDAIRRVIGISQAKKIEEAKDHWLDHLMDDMKNHIRWFGEQVSHIADKSTPPEPVYEYVSDIGNVIRGAYNSIIASAIKAGGNQLESLSDIDFKLAAEETEQILEKCDDKEAAMLAAYAESGFGGSDAVCWQSGIIASTMFSALRSIGLLGELIPTFNGIELPKLDEFAKMLGIEVNVKLNHIQVNGVWFNVLGDKKPKNMRDIDEARRKVLKTNIEKGCPKLVNRKITIKDEGERKVVYNDANLMLGYVGKGEEDRCRDEMTIIAAQAKDGNLKLVLY